MKSIELYKVILEDSYDVYRVYVPADSVSGAKAYVAGNGDIISVTDVSSDFPISLDSVRSALRNYGFGSVEQDLIIRMLQAYSNTF